MLEEKFLVEDSFSGHGLGTGATKCLRCGRSLSNPKSRQAGYGPVCLGKTGGIVVEKNQITDRFLDTPHIRERIVLKRIDGIVYTNVPHAVIHHSPTGYEFGYGGSGPADLALNICEIAVAHLAPDADHSAVKLWDGSSCSEEAWMLHQDLKWALVASIDQERGGEIPWSAVESFVRTWEDPTGKTQLGRARNSDAGG